MGRDNKSSIIIEFNGLPGSGKSTICRKMLEMPELFINPMCTSFEHSFIDKYFRTVWLNLNCLSLYNASKSYINSFPCNDNKARRSDLLLMHFFRMYLNFLKYSRSNILVIDQGIIQCLLSVPHNKTISEIDGVNAIVSFCNRKIFVL